MIKTVIFDIGNVLADFAWEPFFRKFGFKEAIFEKLANATVRSPQWHEFDRGALSHEEIIEAFISNDPDVETEIRMVFQNVNGIVTKRDYAVKWIEHLKREGFQVLYLSNFAEITKIQCMDALEFIPYTDGGIMSYELQLVKPDPAFFQALIDKYDLKPEECVFIDDTWVNVEAAAAMGFHIVHAKEHSQVLEALCELGVPSY
jgi:putative hydrolase of the HAD superfamily